MTSIITAVVLYLLAISLCTLGWYAWEHSRMKSDKVFSVVFYLLGVETVVVTTYVILTGQLYAPYE